MGIPDNIPNIIDHRRTRALKSHVQAESNGMHAILFTGRSTPRNVNLTGFCSAGAHP